MTKNILLIDTDDDSVAIVMHAAAQTGYSVRLATQCDHAFKILNCDFDDIDLVVLDADPGAHAMALLEAINACAQRPPVIVLTALEEEFMTPIAAAHGATACLSKPLTIEKMTHTLRQTAIHRRRTYGCSCDAWGHVREQVLVGAL